VQWQLQSSWTGGYVAQLTVASSAPRTGWQVSWPDASATAVVNAWGMTCAPAGGVMSCTGSDWARTLTPNQPQHVGLQVATSGAAPASPVLSVR
jgi:endoglucanase